MSNKMNVLFIITDQQRADHLSCAGNPILKTPNIDRLALEGMRFTSAFCANPICTPNRASILTGMYPNMHGSRSNGINLSEDVPIFTETLRKRGWHTVAIGKLHHNFFHDPHFDETVYSAERISHWISPKKESSVRKRFKKPYYGYEEVEIVLGHGDLCAGHYLDWLEERNPGHTKSIKERMEQAFKDLIYETNLPEELYQTSYVTERSIAFLERKAKGEYGDKPFFLFCSYPDPHHPMCPPGRFSDMYKPEDIELPPSFNDLENVNKHPYFGNIVMNPPLKGVHLLQRSTTEQEARRFIAKTYGAISMIDEGVGKILSALEKLGMADNTIVIYTSDHGDLMGDHGLILKGLSPFNGVLNVPMIWKVPGVTKPDSISDSLMSSIDFAPTLLKLLRVSSRHQPPDMQGVNITPVLKDPTAEVRNFCLIEEDEEIFGLKARLRYLVTNEYKMTVYLGLRDYGEIYDRKNDPHELNNLWFKEPQLRQKLIEKLFYENLEAQSRYPKRVAQG